MIIFPFADLTSVKVRPALVISKEEFNNHNQDAIFIMITSGTGNIRDEEILIRKDSSNFTQTGLKKESVIRTPKIHYLSQSLAQRKLGAASPELLTKTLQQLHNLFFTQNNEKGKLPPRLADRDGLDRETDGIRLPQEAEDL